MSETATDSWFAPLGSSTIPVSHKKLVKGHVNIGSHVSLGRRKVAKVLSRTSSLEPSLLAFGNSLTAQFSCAFPMFIH